MQDFPVKNATLEPLTPGFAIFRTLVRTTTELWFFLSLPSAKIADCSDSFLSLWNLPRELAMAESKNRSIKSAAIPKANAATQSTVPPFDEFVNQVRATVLNHEPVPLISSFRIESHVVLDDSGLPIGNLVYLHPVTSKRAAVIDCLSCNSDSFRKLSPREQEVVRLLSEGATNKAISIRLDVSVKTIEKYRSSAMKKLNVRSFAELIRSLTLIDVLETNS